MTGRYKQSQYKNKSRFYIFLSVVFVVVMFKWGIPIFMNLVAGNGGQRVDTAKDIIPPQSPVISALPEATNSSRVSIEGFTEAGATVELLVNDKVDKVIVADETGAFSFEAVLISGQNRILLRAKDETGNESMSEVFLIQFDNKPINLVITSPKDGSEYFGKTSQVVDIKGSVDKPNSQVLINNSFVQVDKNGSFVHRFMLSGGDNNITIAASDRAGNTTESKIRIIYTP
jgi:hypothetical protein